MRSTRRRFLSGTLAGTAAAMTGACWPFSKPTTPPPTTGGPPPKGLHQPQNPDLHHAGVDVIVRVYMVPQAVSGTKPGDPLTAANRATVEAHLREVAEALRLRQSSIIVVGSLPYSWTNPSEQKDPPPGGALGDGHHETLLRVWPGDRVVWQTDQPFSVHLSKALPPGLQAASAPASPFMSGGVAAPDYSSTEDLTATDARFRQMIRTDPADKSAIGQQYKVTIHVAGMTVDPDLVCGSPPGF